MTARRIAAALALAAVALAAWLLVDGVGEPDSRGASVTEFTVDAEAIDSALPVKVVVPAESGRRPPLLVFLHGRGGDEGSAVNDELFAALDELGPRAPIVAFPRGGEASFWHDRADGDWGAYVTDDVIPQVTERFGADRRRVAIGGISMGGFGALDIARLTPGRFCAAGGHSAAIWETAGETAAGAFDDAEDFAGHDLVAAAREDPTAFAAQSIWLDAGTEDPFVPGIDALAAALRDAGAPLTERRWPGGHDGDYWRRHWDEYLRFYARELRRCGNRAGAG